ncbi:hypothetical protein OHB49_44060 (plasmid) [Streptomyces sp. NBC_01717]|uniref:type II toxin-antitoxin system RelE family toxin n=1 Tax=Streptomyces sp. NBC_01717 TaxID=2975918 RepID=UPI002E36B66E|nr:hypothetical protein [Streptomyces sp. NBC_01717]
MRSAGIEADPDGVWLPRDEPRPEGAFSSTDMLRIHVGVYRVMCEIGDQQIRVSVVHLGRLR